MIRALGLAVALAGILIAAPAHGQTAPPRLAAASDCLANPNCGPGFRRVYKVDVKPVYVPMKVADSGISALDDGLAEIAVAFSSNPEVARPDIVALRDDRKMIGPDPIVPVMRNSLFRAYGKHLLRRLDDASAVLTTRALRSLNQSVEDGRLPEAVGGEFIDANALGGNGGHRRGPRIVIGFQEFAENETLAYMYAEALSSDGYRVKVRPAGGLRPEALRALRRGKIDMYPGYAGSLLSFISGKHPKTPSKIMKALRRELAKRHLRPAHRTPAQDRNMFVTKVDTARALGIRTLSDLAKLWPPAR